VFSGFLISSQSLITRLNAVEADISTINTTIGAHDVRISYNLSVFSGFLISSQSLVLRLNAVEADLSTINTTLTAHDGRIFTNTADVFQLQTNGHTDQIASLTSTISTIQSNATFHANALGVLTTRVNNQADTILALTNDIDTLGDQIASSGDINALTSTVDGLTTQVSTISTRSFNNMQSISALQPIVSGHTTQINANTTLADALLNASQFNSGLISVIDGKILALRTDTDANTLSNTQFLNALQYQSTTIFAIDTAIQISNGKIASLEASQIIQDDLIREFDQLFNEPVNGVVDKLNNLRNNVNDNNLILGTLSTHTTSLLTAMTIIYTRVQVLEDNAPVPPSNFDLFEKYPSTNYVGGGVIQTSYNITIEQALEIGLTISNLYSIVHNVGGTTYYCPAGGSLVSGQSINRTTFVKK
jgi:chromosome segregation ATPase